MVLIDKPGNHPSNDIIAIPRATPLLWLKKDNTFLFTIVKDHISPLTLRKDPYTHLSIPIFLPGSSLSSQRALVRIGVPRGFLTPDRSYGTVWSWLWPPPCPRGWLPPPTRSHSPGCFGRSRRKATRRWSRGQLLLATPRRCDRCQCQNPHWCRRYPVGGTLPLLSPLTKVKKKSEKKVTNWSVKLSTLVAITLQNWFSHVGKFQMETRNDFLY